MPLTKINNNSVFLDDTWMLTYPVGSIWEVTVKNYEGDGTGADAEKGVGVRYVDENGEEKDERVPNNGSLTFRCKVQEDGKLCEVYAIWADATGDYEDKLVDCSAVSELTGESITFDTIHIGDNPGTIGLSYVYCLPSLGAGISGTVTIDWGDGTVDTANYYLYTDWQDSDKRWCEPYYEGEFSGLAGVRVLKDHTYASGGNYTITVSYKFNNMTVTHTYSVYIDTPPWTDETADGSNPPPDPEPPTDDTVEDSPLPPLPSDLPTIDDIGGLTTTPSLQITDVSTDKKEYSWRVDINALISLKVIDNNQIPVDGCLIFPAATSLRNGQYQITYPLPQTDDTVEVNITAEKSGYESAQTTVSLRVSEWGNYILKASVLTDKDKYLYASTEPAKITVIVEDKAGNRVSGCTITDNFGNTYTDNGNGEYVAYMDISNLPVGRYDLVVKVTKDNYKSNIVDTTPQTETFVYDGVNSSFKLKYKLVEPISVKINGVETTNYTITNDAYGDCYLNILDTMNASDIVEITYNYYTDSIYFDIVESLEPITVIVTDDASIAKYGKRPMETLYIPSLQSVEEAEQIGLDYLAQYANPRPVWEIETYLDKIPPKIGDEVYTNDKYWNIIKKRINYIEYSIKANDKRIKLGLEYEKEILIDILESLKG